MAAAGAGGATPPVAPGFLQYRREYAEGAAAGARMQVLAEGTGWRINAVFTMKTREGHEISVPVIYTSLPKDGKPVEREEAISHFLQQAMAINNLYNEKLSSGEAVAMFREGAGIKMIPSKEEGKSHWEIYVHLPVRTGGPFTQAYLAGPPPPPNAPRAWFRIETRGGVNAEPISQDRLEYERNKGKEYPVYEHNPAGMAVKIRREGGQRYTTGLKGFFAPLVGNMGDKIGGWFGEQLGIHTHKSLAEMLAKDADWVTAAPPAPPPRI